VEVGFVSFFNSLYTAGHITLSTKEEVRLEFDKTRAGHACVYDNSGAHIKRRYGRSWVFSCGHHDQRSNLSRLAEIRVKGARERSPEP
jgi:hypothetical protein